MDDSCFRPEEVASVLARIDEPPVRAHLDACPACRALVAGYRAFLAGDTVRGPHVAAAEQHLAGWIEDLTRTQRAPDPPMAPTGVLRRWRPVGVPRRRGVIFAMASAAAVAAIVFHFLGGPTRPAETPLYRGRPPAQAPSSAATRLADGSVRLSWPAVRDADGYRVQVLSPALRRLWSITVTGDTTTTLDAETQARFGEQEDAPLLWDLAPIVRGDTLAPGEPRVLPRE